MKIVKKLIKQLATNYSWLLVLFGYGLINIIFNYKSYWQQMFADLSKVGSVYGEVQAYEWALERFYQTLISGQNPFGGSTAILYPFGLNFSLLDLGYGLFFPIFRPFLSPHQTLYVLVTISLIIANIGMYLLLRKLNFSKILSFVIGAAYGYMTFLMPRGGHLSYWCLFVFPWFYYFLTVFFTNKKTHIKFLSIVGSSIIFVLTLWLNFYYFIILLISIFSLLTYFLVFNSKIFFSYLKKYWQFLFFKGFFILLLLIPWLKGLYDFFIFDLVSRTQGWGGAIEFSSDLFNYFIPSEYGYLVIKFPILLRPFALFLKLYTPTARSIFENFTYPGVIILFSYVALIFIYKKFDKKTKQDIKPFLFTSVVFFILTLGPFLHVFGHWTLTVDDGIKIVVPLPYIILHYIPFLNNIRVPGRLIVGFIFFAYIVCAYLINHLLKNKPNRFKTIFFLVLFVIFIMDQRVTTSIFPPPQTYPYKIFNRIKLDPEKVSVLEIPFTIRDGFTYFGDGNAIGLTVGQLIHGKSAIGGYIGRIADYKKNYYQNDAFIGYIGRLIDEGLLGNPIINKEDLANWQSINVESSKRTVDFLDLKYIINDDSKLYSASLSAIYKDLGYEKKLIDDKYSLWEKKLDNNEYKNIEIGNSKDNLLLGFGWHNQENDFRWVERRSSTMFKIQKSGKYLLNFKTASFYKDQQVTVYLNKKKVAKIKISTEVKDYSIPVKTNFEQGINTIYFIFDKYYQPAGIFPGNIDERKISAKFFNIHITKVK